MALGVVGVGALMVFVGFALLAGLTLAGAVLGTGFAAYRWLRGDKVELPRPRVGALDPSLEVQPRTLPIASPARRADDADGTPPT